MSGLFCLELSCHVFDAVGNINLCADHNVSDQHNAGAVGVVRRENGNGIERKVDVRNDRFHVAEQRVGAKHNALALAGRTGGINEKRELSVVEFNLEVGLAVFGKFFAACLLHCLKALLTLCAEENDGSFESANGNDFFALCRNVSIDKQIINICILCSVSEVCCRPILIKRNEHRADEKRSVIGHDEIVGHFADNDNVLALHAAGEHFGCERSDVISEFRVSNADLFLCGRLYLVRKCNLVTVFFCGGFNEMTKAFEFFFGVYLMLIHGESPYYNVI